MQQDRSSAAAQAPALSSAAEASRSSSEAASRIAGTASSGAPAPVPGQEADASLARLQRAPGSSSLGPH